MGWIATVKGIILKQVFACFRIRLKVYHARRAVKTSHFSPCRPAGMPWRTLLRRIRSVRLCHQLTAVCRRPDSSSTPFSLGPSSPRTRTGPLASCHGLWPLARPKPRTPLPLGHSHSPAPARPLLTHSPPTPRTSQCHYPTTTAGPGTPRARTTPRYENTMIPVPAHKPLPSHAHKNPRRP